MTDRPSAIREWRVWTPGRDDEQIVTGTKAEARRRFPGKCVSMTEESYQEATRGR